MNKKIYSILVGMVVGLAVSGYASATSISYYMTESNYPRLIPGGSDYMQVTIFDSLADDKIHFTVALLPDLVNLAGSNVGIDRFSFNGPVLAQSNIEVTGWYINNNMNDSLKYGEFSNRLANFGKGYSPLPLEFSIDAESDTVNTYAKPFADGSALFLAHIGGFSIGCDESESGFEGREDGNCKFGKITRANLASIQIAPPSAIPVPATAWLFVSGLLGMVGVSRRISK